MSFTKIISTALNLGLTYAQSQEEPRVCIPSAITGRGENMPRVYTLKIQSLIKGNLELGTVQEKSLTR